MTYQISDNFILACNACRLQGGVATNGTRPQSASHLHQPPHHLHIPLLHTLTEHPTAVAHRNLNTLHTQLLSETKRHTKLAGNVNGHTPNQTIYDCERYWISFQGNVQTVPSLTVPLVGVAEGQQVLHQLQVVTTTGNVEGCLIGRVPHGPRVAASLHQFL